MLTPNALLALCLLGQLVPLVATGRAATGHAAVPRLTLSACLEMALQRSPDVESFAKEEDAARWRFVQQRRRYRPSLAASVLEKRQTQPPDLTTPAFPGFSFPFGAPDIHERSVVLNQTLYSFGRIESARRGRRLSADAAGYDTAASRQSLVYQVTKSFWDVLLASELVAVQQESLAQLERHYQQSLRNFRAGLATEFDAVRAHSQVASARSGLARANHDRRVAMDALLNVTAAPEEWTEITAEGAYDTRSVGLNHVEALRLAALARPDLNALLLRHQAALQAVHEVKTAKNPLLSAEVAHDITKGIRPPFESPVEINHVAVTLNVPIWDGGVIDARAKEAEVEAAKIEQQIRKQRDSIRLEISGAYARLDETLELIRTAGETVSVATQSLQLAESGYREGLRTSLDVLDAQVSLSSARNTLAQAHHDYAVARAGLERTVARPVPPGPPGSAPGPVPIAPSTPPPAAGEETP